MMLKCLTGSLSFASWREAARWLEEEGTTLINAALQEAEQANPDWSWQVAEALFPYFLYPQSMEGHCSTKQR
jgi:hypothetical protein